MSARRLRFGLATVLGLAKRGFFIPYRYADTLPPPGARPPYRAIEALFDAHRAAFVTLIDGLGGYADAFAAIGPDDPPAPRWNQDWFPRLDAAVAYALVRRGAPARIVEVGSGHSTRFMARAVADGGLATRITAIDPAPRAALDGLDVEIIRKPVHEAGAAPFADLAGNHERLLVVFDGVVGLAKVRMGDAQVAEGVAFPPPVADLAGDFKAFLVVLDGAAWLPKTRIRVAQVAQVVALGLAVPEPPSRLKRRLQPLDPGARVQPQSQHVSPGVRVGNGEPGRRLVLFRFRRSQGLAGLDVGALGIEQGQAFEHVVASFQVKIVGI